MQMESKLSEMIGKLYIYKQKEHRILRFQCESSFTKIVTSREDIIVNHDEAKEQLTDFLLVDESSPALPSKPSDNLPATNHMTMPELSFKSNVPQLSEIIMGNIEKLKTDPSYISQASAINDQLKTLVELGKTEIEMAKMQLAIEKISHNNRF